MKYLDPADHNPARITKADKDFAKELDFKNIKLLFKVRDKIEKKNSISISVFSYENKLWYPIYVSKKDNHVDLLLIEEEGQRLFVFIKNLNKFMSDYKLHCGEKNLYL